MTECFDFKDGNGKVPAHRHSSGGGWVADTAYVAESVYVGNNAKVYGNAEIFGYAVVSGYARVFGNAKVSGIVRSDGHTFVYIPDDDGVMKVQAGCRDFTMKEAKDHWRKTRGGTPLGYETMEILKSLKRLSKVRPEGCV